MSQHFRLFAVITAYFACSAAGWAQSGGSAFHRESPEDFRLEITGSAWIADSTGHLLSSGSPIDFLSDLNIGQQKPTFFGKLVFKPRRKHRIVVEGTPLRESGDNTINRSLVYQGESFNISERIQSAADLNYVFAGYQYDILSGPKGHLGLSVGGAYLGARGSLVSSSDVPATGTQTVGLPLAGMELRLFPIPRHRFLEIDGGVRGMTFGNYGYFVETNGNAGICLGPITFLAGYRTIRFDLHETGTNPDGIAARLQGPTASAMFRW